MRWQRGPARASHVHVPKPRRCLSALAIGEHSNRRSLCITINSRQRISAVNEAIWPPARRRGFPNCPIALCHMGAPLRHAPPALYRLRKRRIGDHRQNYWQQYANRRKHRQITLRNCARAPDFAAFAYASPFPFNSMPVTSLAAAGQKTHHPGTAAQSRRPL